MKALFHELTCLREDCVANIRNRQHIAHLHTGQGLQRPGIGQGMDASANEKISQHGPRGGIVCHLVDPELLRPGARLEEKVVQKVQDQVAGGKDVIAGAQPIPRESTGKAVCAEAM